jgi:hypothetical protein
MCVSAQFCEQHLLLLFKILETSKDPVVRGNIVIALGDIALCFGSLIDDVSGARRGTALASGFSDCFPRLDPSHSTQRARQRDRGIIMSRSRWPWTGGGWYLGPRSGWCPALAEIIVIAVLRPNPQNSERLYQGLTDPDPGVKKNTLMVLTHLILNGMIKVKGQLGEMAKCVEDEDERIADLAKMFFKELSTKDNALYNNLQDVISHLSIGKHAVDEETFEKTMKYIFQFIEKVSQLLRVVGSVSVVSISVSSF